MGKDLSEVVFSAQDRTLYRQKVRRCLDVLALMLDDAAFDMDSRMTGLEIELNLMDADAEPAMRNAEILANLADPTFQYELGQFNLELNARPRVISGDGFADYEDDILRSLARAEDRAGKADSTIVLIGSLPTLTREHLVLANLSANERYRALNDQIVGARGEQFQVDIRGVERLQTANDSIVGEAACTSVQFHMQVPPDRFAAHWNAGFRDVHTLFEIWREGVTEGTASCGQHDDNGFMPLLDIVKFDENENAVAGLPPVMTLPIDIRVSLPATSWTNILDTSIYPYLTNGATSGWIYFNLDRVSDDAVAAQAWVGVTTSTRGRSAFRTDAAALGNGCSPPVTKSEVDKGTTVIGPAENNNR